MKKCAAFAIAALAVTAGSAFAEGEYQVDTEVGVLSHYVWRGNVLDERPTMQGNVTVSHESGFFTDLWFNHALDSKSDLTDDIELNEIDFTAGYASTYENIDYSAGMIYYTFPAQESDDTVEFFATAALNDQIVTPYLELYWDAKEVNGLYAKMGLEKDIDVSEAMTVTVGAAMGYGSSNYSEVYFGEQRDTLLDATVYATASYALSEKAAINGSVLYSDLADGAVNAGENSDRAAVAGVSYSYSF